MKQFLSFLILLVLATISYTAYCQVDRGGVPRSFHAQFVPKSQLQPITLMPPDMNTVQKEDLEDARLEKPYRVGIEVPVSLSPDNAGQWDALPGGGRMWRLALKCEGSQGLGLNYSKLNLPEGSDLFVYNADHSSVIGAFTSDEIPFDAPFATRPVYGDGLVLEYYEPSFATHKPVIEITGLVYMYRGFEPRNINAKGTTGSCEVNVNCEEGQNWQNQKQGVVKIYIKIGSKYFYCTGTILNNTSQDFTGLLLTAAHCSKDNSGGVATADDLSRWIFYFNYETTGCTSSGAPEYTIVGATKLAIGDTPSDIGSDFLLLKTINTIPHQYNPYFCGWDAGTGGSMNGVCIHHPNGDVKKISTYVTPLNSGTWETTPNTHWIVSWAATNNGHGVTEGGSSGSPLFDDEGLLIGTLTGGPSSCANTSGEDMFGKVPYSWVSNGTTADMQLKPWLDPGNTGLLKLPGSYNEKFTVADFSANSIVIPYGGTVNFQDLSSGKPDSWHWYFQGGTPAESTEQNPLGIRFNRFGTMNVKLVTGNNFNTDTIVKVDYITIKSVVSPNPCYGTVSILTDINDTHEILIDVFDSFGKIAQHFEYPGAVSTSYSIILPEYGNVFIIRFRQGDRLQTHKVIVLH